MAKKDRISRVINRAAHYLEIGIAFLLIAVIILMLFQLLLDVGSLTLSGGELDFDRFLARAFNLIIGLEFTRMLCRHTGDTIIEVLLFATARQLIIAHESAVGAFLGVLSIAVLFAVRKYLLPREEVLSGKGAEKSVEEQPG